MMKAIVVFLMILVSCSQGEGQKSDLTSERLFNSYIESFKNCNIPLTLDRNQLLDLSYVSYDSDKQEHLENNSSVINATYDKFIPAKLKNDGQSKLRSLFVVRRIKGFYLVLIAKDIFEDGEQRALELFAVIYEKSGGIIDVTEVAGYEIDVYDGHFEITKDFKIISKRYEFKQYPDANPQNYSYAVETVSTYELETNGKFLKTQKKTREGYFSEGEKGYVFVD